MPLLDRVIRENENPFRSGERRPFTLIFRGPKEREVLPEGLYDCEIDGGRVSTFTLRRSRRRRLNVRNIRLSSTEPRQASASEPAPQTNIAQRRRLIPPEVLRVARRLHAEQRLEEAERAYRYVIQHAPADAGD